MNSPSASLKNAASGCTFACAKARGLGIGVGIERGIIDRAAARPEAGAADFVRIGLAGDRVGQMRHAAGMARRAAAGKARHREIEAAPEEMHRARLAEKAGAELLEHAVGIDQDLQEAPHRIGIVGGMRLCPAKTASAPAIRSASRRWRRECRVRRAPPSRGVEARDRLSGQREAAAARRRWSKCARRDR